MNIIETKFKIGDVVSIPRDKDGRLYVIKAITIDFKGIYYETHSGLKSSETMLSLHTNPEKPKTRKLYAYKACGEVRFSNVALVDYRYFEDGRFLRSPMYDIEYPGEE